MNHLGGSYMRVDGRNNDELRSVYIEKDFINYPEGSVLISVGQTKVICNATTTDKVPPFLRGSNKGWVTAEYAMLPRATDVRTVRESTRGKVSGRTMEIQRLIGRALRGVIDLEALGEITIHIDCDVIQADGGTRTASITGAFVAMAIAVEKIYREKALTSFPIKEFLSAVSVGIIPERGAVLDLNYAEDSTADVDMNIVMTSHNEFVELQGSGEEAKFSVEQLQELLKLGQLGIEKLILIQKEVLGEISLLIEKK